MFEDQNLIAAKKLDFFAKKILRQNLKCLRCSLTLFASKNTLCRRREKKWEKTNCKRKEKGSALLKISLKLFFASKAFWTPVVTNSRNLVK
jgi:hypothetical protein